MTDKEIRERIKALESEVEMLRKWVDAINEWRIRLPQFMPAKGR